MAIQQTVQPAQSAGNPANGVQADEFLTFRLGVEEYGIEIPGQLHQIATIPSNCSR